MALGVVAYPLNGLLISGVGGSHMHTRCVDSDQHCELKND